MMQQKKFFISFLIFFALFFVTSFSYAYTAGDALTQILGNIQTIQTNFQQTIFDKNNRMLQQSYGTMSMQRPGRFRWEITRPTQQLIIANGRRLWIYDRDLAQVTVKSLAKAAGEAPALLLTESVENLQSNFDVDAIQTNDPSLQWFSLVPRNRGSLFSSLQLGFQNNQLRAMQMKDRLGQTTMIRFQNMQQNIALSSGLFVFNPHGKLDVIDETAR